MIEETKDIPGYEGLLSITKKGRVFRYSYVDSTDRLRKGRWYKTTPDTGGYLKFNYKLDGQSVTLYVHRLVQLAWNGPIHTGLVVDHIDRDNQNNHHANLRAVTYSENARNVDLDTCRIGAWKRATNAPAGVGYSKQSKRWRAYITIGYKYVHLGYFNDIFDPVSARLRAEKEREVSCW